MREPVFAMIEKLFRNRGVTPAVILGLLAAIAYVVMAYTSPPGDAGFHIATVAEGLHNPWSLAFVPNGDMLLSEKYTGHLRVIHEQKLQPEPIANLPQVYPHAQGGLLEVAIHPKYTENHVIYITYSKPGPLGSTTALGQAHFDAGHLLDYKDIFVTNAWGQDNGQYGGKIAFGSDGMLYL